MNPVIFLKIVHIHDYWSLRFVEALSKLNERMMERQSKIGIHSNLREYRKANPDTDMKTVFIVVNELMDLIAGSEKDEADDLIRIFTSLLTKGAGAGFRLVFMAQSMRKDIDPRYGKIFANITTRISVKIVNQEEAEIAGRWLPRDELLRLFSLQKYNAVHIEDGAIKREFRAYHVTQTTILDWIRKTFQTEEIFGNPKLDEYYLHSRKVGKLSMKEAMEEPFNLSRAEWDELVKQLESRSEIERKNGLPISFKPE